MIITTTIVPDTPAVLLAGDVLTLVTLLSQPGAPGVSAWGSITGTLSAQTDLQAALDGKAPSLGSDDNYVTDAEKIVIGNTSGINTGDVIDWANPIAINTATALTIGKHHVISDLGSPADYTVTLPAVSGNAGKLISWEIAADATKIVTVDGNAAETINLVASVANWAKERMELSCDGTAWTCTVDGRIPITAVFEQRLATEQTLALSVITKTTLNTVISEDIAGSCNPSTGQFTPPRKNRWLLNGFWAGKKASHVPTGADVIVTFGISGTTFPSAPNSISASVVYPQIANAFSYVSGAYVTAPLLTSDTIELISYQDEVADYTIRSSASSSILNATMTITEVLSW